MKYASKFLVIGIGSIGISAVTKTADSIYAAFPDSFRAVIMDTDETVKKITHIPNTESLHLDASDGFRAVQNRAKSPVLNSWLPKSQMNPETNHGLFGCKFMGRLSLSINIAEVTAALDKALSELKDKESCHDFCTEVFICATLGGGTSALMPDLAYLTSLRLENAGLNGRIHAVIPISSSLPEAEEATAANVYAGLMEINHWMHKGTLHRFAIDPEEREDWKAPEDENVLSRKDDSTAAIMANLDIFLADNVNNINPGFKSSKDKENEKLAQNQQNNVNKFFDLNDSSESPFSSIILTSVQKFDGTEEINSACSVMRRFHYWSLYSPELFSKLMFDIQTDPAELQSSKSPAVFTDFHSYQLTRPISEILDVIYGTAANTSLKELSTLLFKKDLGEDKIRGTREADAFIKSRRLDIPSISQQFQERWESTHSGTYYVPVIVKKKAEEFKKNPLYAQELQKSMQDLDASLKALCDPDQKGQEIFEKFSACKQWYIDEFKQALDETASAVVNSQHNCIAMHYMLEELSRIFSFSLSALHEKVNELGSESMKLEIHKDKDLQSVVQFNPSIWAKLTGKADPYLAEACFKSLEEYYANQFQSYMTREIINIFLAMIDIISELKAKIAKLQSFLEDSVTLLNQINSAEYVSIITGADENLISVQEAADYIRENTSAVNLDVILEAADERTGFKMLEIPNIFTPQTWAEFIKETTYKKNTLNPARILESLTERYYGNKITAFVQQVCNKLKNSSEAITNVPVNKDRGDSQRENIFIAAFDCSPQNENEAAAVEKLKNAVDTVEFKGEPCIFYVPQSESADFISVFGRIRCSDLNISEYKNAYLKSMARGARFLHSRADVKLKSPIHISERQKKQITLLLAQAFKLKVLTERKSSGFGMESGEIVLSTSLRTDISAFKSCLKIYEDAAEALVFEGELLRSLLKWRSEMTSQSGVQGWLNQLAAAEDVSVQTPELAALNINAYIADIIDLSAEEAL